MTLSPDQQRAFDIVKRGKSVYLTGPAGCGKTYLTNVIADHVELRAQRTVFRAASTGIAASHIGGMTAYRLFGVMPTEVGPVLRDRHRAPYGLDNHPLFIIDEVSMLRCDVLAVIDRRLRGWGDEDKVFGGFQMLFVGDWSQLPPVVKPREANAVREVGGNTDGFAFQAPQWSSIVPIVLTTAHRQGGDEAKFRKVLADVRNNNITERHIAWMNRNFNRGPAPHSVIRLCNTRAQVARVNAAIMPQKDMRTFTGKATGSYARDVRNRAFGDLPLPYTTTLSQGCRVMMKKNDDSGNVPLANGDLGTLIEFSGNVPLVRFDRHPKYVMPVPPKKCSRIEGMVRKGDKFVPNISGSFEQIPLIAAHAITIHASQGLSLPAIELSMDKNSNFSTAGMMYVALSRCESLAGVYITRDLDYSVFRRHAAVIKEERRMLAAQRAR